jgi:uncharacterized repeat protein (TIGR03803 family)
MTPGGTVLTLVHFTGNGVINKGANPQAKLFKSGMYFYGSTLEGGLNNRGTVFRMTSNGTLGTMVHMSAADGAGSNGAGPWDVVLGTDGALFGTTRAGGTTGDGTFFRLTVNSSMSTRFNFSGTDGSLPIAGVILGGDGNFYGTTKLGGPGGTQGSGTVFKITPAGVLTTLTSFTGDTAGSKGTALFGELEPDGNGGFLGVTNSGGAFGVGTVFRVTPAGAITTLVEFTGKTGAAKGTNPQAGLVKHTDGNFYGVTRLGGSTDNGTIFKLTPAGVFTTLVEFTGNTGAKKGITPGASLRSGADGNLYGTTEKGGAGGYGTVFRMTPAGVLTTLVEFTGVSGAALGNGPTGALVIGADGSFYGTTALGGDPALDDLGQPQIPNGSGTVFSLTTSGTFTSLVKFTAKAGSRPGAVPLAGLMRASDGSLYGTTSQGGANSVGTIFKLTQAGVFSTVFEFKTTGAVTGLNPGGKLTEAADGNFYSTTLKGGATGDGTIFRMTPAGVVSNVLEFTGSGGAAPGGTPGQLLLPSAEGHLYGTTAGGGLTSSGSPAGGGQIYRLRFGPTPVTQAATGTVNTTATLNGTINPNGDATSATFEYGTDPALATFTTVNAGTTTAGTTAEPVTAPLTGLTPGVTYYFRVTGLNASNTQRQRGAILSFTPTPLTDLEVWRQQWFGTTEDSGNAANMFDADNDGLVNLVEYAFGLNPTLAGSNALPEPVITGGFFQITFTGVAGIRYDVEWSPSMEEGTWDFLNDTGSGAQHIFRIPTSTGGKLFLRMKVSVLE